MISKKQKGFTIVELLVVIVVIGILAAITIVSYNGVQTRAENTKTVTAVGEYAKALQIIGSDNGVYPITAYPCLGPQSLTCANQTDTTTPCLGLSSSTGNSLFEAAIKTQLTAFPVLSTQKMDCGGKLYSGGFYYSAADGKTAKIIYFLKGSTDCKTPGVLTLDPGYPYHYLTSSTVCSTSLPSL